MQTNSRATVIVPTYKHQDYLRCSIFSILNSTVPVKVIVVPVAGDEPTKAILDSIDSSPQAENDNLEIIQSEKADVIYQMQLGLKRAHTEYFTVFGSDDFMLPNMVGRMLELADASKHPNPIIGLSFAFTDSNLNITSIHRLKPFSRSRMMKGGYIPDIALVKTDSAKFVRGFIDDGRDWGYLSHFAMYHRLLKRTFPKVILSPDVGFLYRQLPNSRHAIRYSTKEGIRMHRVKARQVADYYWRD